MPATLQKTLPGVFEDNLNPYQLSQKISAEILFENKFLHIYSVKVNSRAWKTVSANNRFVDFEITSLSESVRLTGKVFVFIEVAAKHAVLPFAYYQFRKALSIQATFDNGRVFISISGNFIPNVNSHFNFKVLVVEPKTPKKYKEFNWENYPLVKKAFKLKDITPLNK